MLHRIRTRLTYANVMSTIAVFVAIGGGTAYAVDEWNGSNIQDETLTGADVRGAPPNLQQDFVDGTLETWDIKDGSLFTVDIADETLGPADITALTGSEIQNGAVGGRHVGEGTLNGGHVANDSLDGFDVHSLNGSDVTDAGLSGADLADGSVGAADLAPDARTFTEVQRRGRTRSFPRGTLTITTNCQAGWRATGGGYRFRYASPHIFVGYSEPTADGRGWTVHASWRERSGEGDNRMTVWAMCAR